VRCDLNHSRPVMSAAAQEGSAACLQSSIKILQSRWRGPIEFLTDDKSLLHALTLLEVDRESCRDHRKNLNGDMSLVEPYFVGLAHSA